MSSARPLSWFELPGVAAAVMPQRPSWYQRYSRYCCTTVRNALLILTTLFAETAIKSFLPVADRYGSTALLVICMLPPAAKLTRPVGLAQPISSAICFDRPITVAVEHVDVS